MGQRCSLARATWRPKLRRIALASAFEPSMMAAVNQIINQRLHHGAMLGCALDQSERVLDALAIDPDRRYQHQVLGDVDAVDLHHHDVE